MNWTLHERVLFKCLHLLRFVLKCFLKNIAINATHLPCEVNVAEPAKIRHRNGSPFSSRLWSQAQCLEACTLAACTMAGLWINIGMQSYKSLNLRKEWQPSLNGWSLCVVCSSCPSPLLTKVGFIGSISVRINFYSLCSSCVGRFCSWMDRRTWL